MKVLFSVGGWTAGGWVFSQMAETAERRRMFTASVLHFLTYFGLDGMDLDWEMPGYDMYGGQPTNPEVCELLMFLSRQEIYEESPRGAASGLRSDFSCLY